MAADLRIQFNKTSDASNRAVMAETDEESSASAHEAEKLKALIRTEVGTLAPVLHSLGYATETKTLEDFGKHFNQYEKVDHDILELAVENTNLKAQRMSFGPVRETVDEFQTVLRGLVPSVAPKDRCRVESLAASAIVAVRQIQVLHAPHIAEHEDSVMTGLEKEMANLDVTARNAVNALSGLVDPKARPQVAKAVAALDRFGVLSAEIVKLSRRNSNVISLDLALRRKPALTATCDNDLQGLQDSLANESFSATR